MNRDYYFVEYRLYGMEKNIIFQTFSQYTNWCYCLENLGNQFEIISIKSSRFQLTDLKKSVIIST